MTSALLGLRTPETLSAYLKFAMLFLLARRQGERRRVEKRTRQTAEAFISSTKANIDAARYLLNEMNFQYVLRGMFSDDALEKFFGQSRQRSGRY